MITKDKYITIPDFLIILKAMSEGTKTISEINRDIKITLAHLYNTKKVLLYKKLITIHVVGTAKRQVLVLTEKGKKVVKATNEILKELDIKDHAIIENLLTSKIKTKNNTMSKKVQNELDELVSDGFQD